jgi:CelD/BcsL family acetyltransferase involved in cellulose biosynthesis
MPMRASSVMPPPPDGLRIQEIGTDAALEALRGDWAALWAAVPTATPFQSPDWLIPWWRHIGEGELLSLALREGAALVGLLSLYVYTRPEDGRRVLFPMGIATTDYLDALILPGREAAAMALALGHLAAHAREGRWEEAEWPQLRPGSPLLDAPAPADWRDTTEPAEPCPVLRLPARMEDLGATVSRKTLRDLRTHRRRAAEAGALRWEGAEPSTLDALFDALLGLHAARWATREEPGVLDSPAVQAMHRAALPGLLRAGLLRLRALRLGGDIVAVLYALVDPPGRAERRLYLYISGFDPGLERLSPGMLLVGQAVEEAIAEGFALADFLRGQERYKYFWGAQDTTCFRRRLHPPSPEETTP